MLGNDIGVQRMLTRAFIKTMPVTITSTPRERIKTSSGGYRLEEKNPRSPQTMRLIEPTQPRLPIRAADGTQREVEFILLGEYDAQMAVHDVFSHDGGHWELSVMYPDNGWERRAAVTRYAERLQV